jgi:NAD(P)-dependent dehydrogenase (short-subunit alcohol dehydrogenase family)
MSDRVIVTGAGRGLGLTLARLLSARGDVVVGTVRDVARAPELAALDGVTVEVLDLSDSDAIPARVAGICERLGGVDLIINNAGINYAGVENGVSTLSVTDMDAEPMLGLFRVNVVAPLLVVRGALPWLRASSNPRVVNITSWLGSIGGYAANSSPNYGYRTTKAALNMASRAMAAELADDGITSVVVNPGWVQTDMGGGAKADLTPEQSASGIIAVASGLTSADTGRFLDWNGEERAY